MLCFGFVDTRTGRAAEKRAHPAQSGCGSRRGGRRLFLNPIPVAPVSHKGGSLPSPDPAGRWRRARGEGVSAGTQSRATRRSRRKVGSHRPPRPPSSGTLHPSPGHTAEAGGWGNWPRVLEQLQPALGPPGMREQAAHQDFYGNLLLEPAAARGLVAAGAAAAGAPGLLTTPRRPEPASAHPGPSRVAGSRRVRGVGGTWGGGGRDGAVGSPGAAGTRAPGPGPAPSSCGDALVPRRERNGPRSRFRGLGGGRTGVGLAVPPRSPASGSWPRFPCPAPQLQLGLRPVCAVSGAFSVLQGVSPTAVERVPVPLLCPRGPGR